MLVVSYYKTLMGNPNLDSQTIFSALLPEVSATICLHVFESVSSTNDEVRHLFNTQSGKIVTVLADTQTQGRGRLGRKWHSPPRGNLYLSLGYRFDCPLNELSGMSLAVGAMVAAAIDEFYGVDLQLKWPNDLYHDGQKIGGILVESTSLTHQRQLSVIGLGLNANMPQDLDVDIDQPWTDLRMATGGMIERNSLASTVLNALIPGLEIFASNGFEPWRADWSIRDFLKDRFVVVKSTDPVSGTAAGVTASGALLLMSNGALIEVFGGEVSLVEVGKRK